MFKVGDKVIYNPSGLAYNVVNVESWALFVSTKYCDEKGVWHEKVFHVNTDQCRPWSDNMPIPVSERIPEDGDYDANGIVLVRNDHWFACHSDSDYFFSNEHVTHWMHTPDWQPRPALRESCVGCYAFAEKKLGKEKCLACLIHKKFEPKPFYIDYCKRCHES